MSIYTTDKVLELLNKTITKENIDTTDDVIIIINEKLKEDIKELYNKSKNCKKCNKHFIVEGKKHSWCKDCRQTYMKDYKKVNKTITRKSRKRNLDYEKEAHCSTCNTTKPRNEFYDNNIYRCKKCVSIIAAECRKKRKEKKEQTKEETK